MPTFSGLVLAGGESRRMGRAKAFVEYKGQPLWKLQADKLSVLGVSSMFISLPAGLEIDGAAIIVRDREPGLGPLGGLEAGFEKLESDFLVVLGVDMPEVPVGFLEMLRQESAISGRGIIPILDGYYYGMVGVYPAACKPLVQEILRGEGSFQQLSRLGVALGLVVAYAVSEEQRGYFKNVNTPDDLPNNP